MSSVKHPRDLRGRRHYSHRAIPAQLRAIDSMVLNVCCELAGWPLGKCSNKKNPGCLARRWRRPGSLESTRTSIAEELAMIKMEKRILLDPKLSILDTERE